MDSLYLCVSGSLAEGRPGISFHVFRIEQSNHGSIMFKLMDDNPDHQQAIANRQDAHPGQYSVQPLLPAI